MTSEREGSPQDEPVETEQSSLVEPVETHHPDGLDLARSAARAAASGPGVPVRRRTKKPATPSERDQDRQERAAQRPRGAGNLSGPGPDERDPQLLGAQLERLVARRGWELDLKVQGVFARWAELVGDEVATHCTPETFADGQLVVRTDSTAWATQLKLLAPTVVRRLNTELGHGTVLAIEVLGPHLPTWKKGPRSVKGRGPRDTYG